MCASFRACWRTMPVPVCPPPTCRSSARGKALEYFSRHYGKVYVDEGRPISVKDALVGINQMIDEDANKMAELPPVVAEPITRQFLRIFEGKTEPRARSDAEAAARLGHRARRIHQPRLGERGEERSSTWPTRSPSPVIGRAGTGGD